MANNQKPDNMTFKEFMRMMLLESVKQYAGDNEHFFETHSVQILNYVDKVFDKCAAAGVDYEKDTDAQSKIGGILGIAFSNYFHSLVNENEFGVNSKININDFIDDSLFLNFGIKKDPTRKQEN